MRNSPSWSAHHYLALVKMWKQANRIGDRESRELMKRIEKACAYLSWRMAGPTDRRRVGGRTYQRKLAKVKEKRKQDYAAKKRKLAHTTTGDQS